jgi:hypothetical protein
MKFRKLIIRQSDNKPHIVYKDIQGNTYNTFQKDDLYPILEQLKFNQDFSLPDRMIQDFIHDGSLFPSFKKSIYFNNIDMEEMVKPLKKYHKKNRKPRILKKQTKKIKLSKNHKKTPKKNPKKIIKKTPKKNPKKILKK